MAAFDSVTTRRPVPVVPGLPTTVGSRVRPLPALLLVGLYVVALGGRFTLDRIGFEEYAGVDLTLLAGAVLAVALTGWWLHPGWVSEPRALPSSTRWALSLAGLLTLSAFWAWPGARIGELTGGIAVLAVLVVGTAMLLGPAPDAGRRVLLWAMLASGAAYTAAGLLLGETDVQGRMTAFGGGANVFARVVCLGMIAAVALAVIYRKSWLMLSLPVMGLATVLSGSRGALVATAAAGLAFLVLFPRRMSLRVAVPLGGIVVAGLGAGVLLLPGRLSEIIDDRFLSIATGDTDYSGRPGLLDAAWQIFAANPLVGGGLDGFWVAYGRGVDLDYPHNIVAEIATTAGVAGLVLFAAFLGSWWRDCRDCSSLSREQVALVLAAIFVLAASMFSGDFYDSRFFWMFAAAAVHPALRSRARRGSPTSAPSPGRPG